MRPLLLASLSAALVCAPLAKTRPALAQASVFCANCATRVQQIWAYAKQVEQTANQITMRINQAVMLQNQIRNMVTLPGQVWHQIEGNFNATQSLFNQGSHLLMNGSVLSGQLGSYRGLMGQVINMPEQYQRWSEQANDNIKATLAGTGLQRQQMRAEQAVLNAIRARSGGAQGAVQAIQASTEMAGAQVNELHRMRETLIQGTAMQANAIALEAERRATEEAANTQFFASRPQPERGNRRF